MAGERQNRRGPIAKVYRAFQDKPEMLELVDIAEAYLREVRPDIQAGRRPSKPNPVATDYPEAFQRLRRPLRDFVPGERQEENNSLQLIGQQIADEERGLHKTEPEPQLERLTEPKPRPLTRRRHVHASKNVVGPVVNTGKSAEGRKPAERQTGEYIAVIGRPEQVDDYPVTTKAIHLSQQEVINIATLERILARYPELQVIEMGRSQRRLVVGKDTTFQRLLEERGIELRWGRVMDAAHYDEVQRTPEYEARKKRYEALFTTSGKREDLEFMFNQEFIEVAIAEKYYGKQRVSMQELADELGLAARLVERKIRVLDVWAGGSSSEHIVNREVQTLGQRIQALRKILSSEGDLNTYRKSLAVGNVLPPSSLPISVWKQWQQLFILFTTDRQKFNHMCKKPWVQTILIDYFGLEGEDKRGNTSEIAIKLGISESNVRYRKNRMLVKFGLLDKE